MQMLLALRGEPILHLQEVDQTARSRRESLTPQDRQRLKELLDGAQPREQGEALFTEQSGKARRLLERVIGLDKQLSLRMSGKDSFYSR